MTDIIGLGDVVLQFRVDNLFDQKYETSGYGWAYGLSEAQGQPVTLVREAEYFVGPERSFYAQMRVELF
jgi:hypothetical protein